MFKIVYNIFCVNQSSHTKAHFEKTETNYSLSKDVENGEVSDKTNVNLSSINLVKIDCEFDFMGRCLYQTEINGTQILVYGEFKEESVQVYFEKVDKEDCGRFLTFIQSHGYTGQTSLNGVECYVIFEDKHSQSYKYYNDNIKNNNLSQEELRLALTIKIPNWKHLHTRRLVHI